MWVSSVWSGTRFSGHERRGGPEVIEQTPLLDPRQYANPYASRRGSDATTSVPDSGSTKIIWAPPKVAVQPWTTRISWPSFVRVRSPELVDLHHDIREHGGKPELTTQRPGTPGDLPRPGQ